jgi:CrcB protein
MTVMLWLGIGLAGGAGAVLRFLLDGRVSARLGSGFPYGTLSVNLSGAGILGFISAVVLNPQLALIVGTGVMGGYTTFSTWMFDSQRLSEDRKPARSWANVILSLIAGLMCTAAGYALGASL